MSQTPSQGKNLTGMVKAGARARDMMTGTEEFGPTSSGSLAGADHVRLVYARESDARELGSVPPPEGVEGKAKAMFDKVAGHEPTVLMDKIGERIAFERTGTRLYEALLSKLEADGGFSGGPTREDLMTILNQEHAHFRMLLDLMDQLDGDPTAMTPSADVAATAASGVLKVITDPRTSLLQGLEAIMIAELTDTESWQGLVALASQANKKELVQRFEAAERTEEEHVAKVRRWIHAGHGL